MSIRNGQQGISYNVFTAAKWRLSKPKSNQMKRKLFFRNEDSERCHERKYFLSEMKDAHIYAMDVFMAVPDKSKEYFWCGAVDDVLFHFDDIACGKDCVDYEPCNGRSGKCRFKTHCYIPGEKVMLSVKIAKEEVAKWELLVSYENFKLMTNKVFSCSEEAIYEFLNKIKEETR